MALAEEEAGKPEAALVLMLALGRLEDTADALADALLLELPLCAVAHVTHTARIAGQILGAIWKIPETPTQGMAGNKAPG
jgi:hypothetical protein